MDEKRRVVPLTRPTSIRSRTPTGGWSTIDVPPFTFTQVTQTRGHAWRSAKQPKTDVGGDFSTKRIKTLWSSDTGSYDSGYAFGYEYVGSEFAISPFTAMNDALALVSFSSDASLRTKGTTAVARSLPTNPVFDAGTFVGELREGLPRSIGKELFKTKLKDYRKVGSEYLNVQFGWLPLVSDLQKFGKAVTGSEKILSQLHRDSGKNIRRKFTFPDEVVNSTYTVGAKQSARANGGASYPYLYYSTGGTTMTVTTSVTTKTWFSGCFTYHVDLGHSTMSKLRRYAADARKLYGIELTPETVWNLAPWSWAVDWEGNIGDVLHNVSRFSEDGLVMRYGYIMQSKTAKISYNLPWQGRHKTSPHSSLLMEVISESKIRRRATPFGFGFDMTALSGRQSAILGALGISRGPRHL